MPYFAPTYFPGTYFPQGGEGAAALVRARAWPNALLRTVIMSGRSGPPTSPSPGVALDPGNYSAGTGVWTDAGTLGFSPSQTPGATAPTSMADSGFKSRPAVQFTATQNLVGSSMPLTNSRSKFTLMVAFQIDEQGSGAVFSTTQDQLGLINGGGGGFIAYLNSASGDYGSFDIKSLAGGQLVTLVYDGTQSGNAGRLRVWRNLVEESLVYTGTIPATTFAGGSSLYLGRQSAGGGFGHRQMLMRIWPDVAFTQQQRDAWQNWAASFLFTKSTSGIVSDGDSISAGFPNNTGNPWPKRAQTLMGWSGYRNSAVTGKTAAGMASGVGTGVLPFRDDWFRHQPCTIMGGINDLAADVAAATIESSLSSFVAAAKAARFPVFISTILPALTINGTQEARRVAVNAWIMAGSSGADHVVDCAADPRLDDPADTTYYESDTVHLNSAGNDVMAELFVAAFQSAGY